MLVESTPKTIPAHWRRPGVPRSDIEADLRAPRMDGEVPNVASLAFEGDVNAADAAFSFHSVERLSAATRFCNPSEAQTVVICL